MKLTELDHLCSAAASNYAVLITRDQQKAVFSVQPPRASGAPGAKFVIEVSRSKEGIAVKEGLPGRLPRFCPERHINFDGSFCLYWAEAEPLDLLSAEGANFWWGNLCEFLLRQQVADKQRRWPGRITARAHGDAARFQMEAERISAEFGNVFPIALQEGRMAVSRTRHGNHHRVRLLVNGRRIATIIEEEKRVMTRRQICKCEDALKSRLPLCACGNHEGELAELTLAILGWDRAEREFFETLAKKKHACCGTIDECPLAGLSATPLLAAA